MKTAYVLILGVGLLGCEALGLTEPEDEEAPKFVSVMKDGTDVKGGFTVKEGEKVYFEVSMTDDGDFGDLKVTLDFLEAADTTEVSKTPLSFEKSFALESRKDARQYVDGFGEINSFVAKGDYKINMEVFDLADHSTKLNIPLKIE